jgi:hypothetical protein
MAIALVFHFFVENFNSSVLENSSDLDDDILQIFDVFCLMVFNSLNTENDINDLRAKAASGKTNAKSNATMDYASLRFAVVAHFNNVLANHHKITEFHPKVATQRTLWGTKWINRYPHFFKKSAMRARFGQSIVQTLSIIWQ